MCSRQGAMCNPVVPPTSTSSLYSCIPPSSVGRPDLTDRHCDTKVLCMDRAK